jgi:hypothetical protein
MTASRLDKSFDVSESTVVRSRPSSVLRDIPRCAGPAGHDPQLSDLCAADTGSPELMESEDILSLVLSSDIEQIRLTMEETKQKGLRVRRRQDRQSEKSLCLSD